MEICRTLCLIVHLDVFFRDSAMLLIRSTFYGTSSAPPEWSECKTNEVICLLALWLWSSSIHPILNQPSILWDIHTGLTKDLHILTDHLDTDQGFDVLVSPMLALWSVVLDSWESPRWPWTPGFPGPPRCPWSSSQTATAPVPWFSACRSWTLSQRPIHLTECHHVAGNKMLKASSTLFFLSLYF